MFVYKDNNLLETVDFSSKQSNYVNWNKNPRNEYKKLKYSRVADELIVIDMNIMKKEKYRFNSLVFGLTFKDGSNLFLDNSVITVRDYENDVILKEIKPGT